MTQDPRVPSPGPPLASGRGGGHRGSAGRGDARRTDTKDPHRSRERALKVLFQADVREIRPVEVLQRIAGDSASLDLLDETDSDAKQSRRARQGRPLDGFSRTLVLGVEDHLEEIDELLDAHAEGWTVHRMPVVDRNILRLGVYELLYEDTPDAIVIDEAIEFAKQLSTERSYRFVHGLLDAVRRDHGAAEATRSDDDDGPAA